MHFTRRAGLLLHITSLPSRFGIGDFGAGARSFVKFLSDAGAEIWQVLPLVPAAAGNSPYSGLSAFAGNPLLISLDDLVADGLLHESDLASYPELSHKAVDYGEVIAAKTKLLKLAFQKFEQSREWSAERIESFLLGSTRSGWKTMRCSWHSPRVLEQLIGVVGRRNWCSVNQLHSRAGDCGLPKVSNRKSSPSLSSIVSGGR